jgi:hypothetical protein
VFDYDHAFRAANPPRLRHSLSDDRQMETIEEYKIIDSDGLDSLAEKVNAALKDGWQPYGAPVIQGGGMAVVCCQAVVKFHQQTGAEKIAALQR